MLAYERKQQILEIMRSGNRVVTVDQLCKSIYASGATIRRDLKELEEAMQKLTDKRCKEIDDLTAKKEAELMAV